MRRRLLAEVAAAALLVALLALIAWWWHRPTTPENTSRKPFACAEPMELLGPDGSALWCGDDSLTELLPRIGLPDCLETVRHLVGDLGTPLRVSLNAACVVGLKTSALSPTVLLALRQPLDLNRAIASDFEVLTGIGPGLAKAIVAERDANGPFCAIADLGRVKGIGPKRLSEIEAQQIKLKADCKN